MRWGFGIIEVLKKVFFVWFKEWRKRMEDKESKIVVVELKELTECLKGILQTHQSEIALLLRDENNEKQMGIIGELKEKIVRLQEERHLLKREVEAIREQKEEYREKYVILNEEYEKKEQLLSADKETIRLLESELEEFKKKNAELQQESARLIRDRDATIVSMEERLGAYENRYREIEEALVLYHRLSGDLQIRLKNILGTGNLYEFLSATRDWNNIEGMWNFTKRRIVEGENTDVKGLVELFRFMFKAYLSHSNARSYVMISPDKGECYDSDKHSIMGTKTDGKIAELLLDGICDAVTKKVVFKAVVKVV